MKLYPHVEGGPLLIHCTIRYMNKDGNMDKRGLRLNDLLFKVDPQKEKVLEKDTTCNSEFMLNHTCEI